MIRQFSALDPGWHLIRSMAFGSTMIISLCKDAWLFPFRLYDSSDRQSRPRIR
jgi:hypothetical protein